MPEETFSSCKTVYNNAYVCIVLHGIISFFAIWGLYSFLSNVEVVLVDDDSNELFPTNDEETVIYQDGLYCGQEGNAKQSYCNDMVSEIIQILYNSTNNSTNSSIIPDSITEQWDCYAYTDYSNKTLYDDIRIFEWAYYVFLTLKALETIFCIIHDCTLAYYVYRDDLSKVKSYPQNHVKDHFLTFTPLLFLRDNYNIPQYLVYVIVIPFVPIYVFDVTVWTYVIYPFWKLIRSGDVSGFSYVSSAWVGISCGFMMLFAILMSWSASGFGRNVPSLNESKCECWCGYILTEKDLYSFMAVTYLFIILNTKFLWSWYKESVHGKQFLYLIQYSIPIFIADKLNHENVAGTMFDGDLNLHNHQNNVCYASHDKYVALEEVTNDNDADNNNDHIDGKNDHVIDVNMNTMTDTTIKYRLNFVLVIFLVSWMYIAYLLITFGSANVYDYAKWLAVAIFSFGCILCGAFCVTYVWLFCNSTD